MQSNRSRYNLLLWLLLIVLLVWSALRLDYSNMASLSWSNIWNILKGLAQPDWSYVYDGTNEDLLHLMLETIIIAFYATIIGTVLSIPAVFLSSFSLWGPKSLVARIGRLILNILRSVPGLIYAILFVRIVGPGPFAGALALGTQLVGMLGKLIAEAMDNVDEKPVEAMIAVGGTSFQAFYYGRLSQVLPIAATHIINHFEITIRSATTLGLVGAGGIGAPVIFALQQRDWSRVSIILLAIVFVVIGTDVLGRLL